MLEPIVLYPAVLFLFGCCVGSFLNVVIYRLPHRVSFISPGSMCPGCGRHLRVLENIPVLSWLIQKGRCRGCGAFIHWRYPAVELLTGLLWSLAGISLVWGWSGIVLPQAELIQRTATMVVILWFISYQIAISFIDYDLTIIPDELNFSGLLLALTASYFLPNLHPNTSAWFPAVDNPSLISLLASGIGALTGGGLLLLITLIGTAVFWRKVKELQKTDPEINTAMGLGDVKLMAFNGAFLGWRETITAFMIGNVLGAIAGTIVKLRSGKSMIPFGPFLCIGSLIVLYFRIPLFTWLSRHFPLFF